MRYFTPDTSNSAGMPDHGGDSSRRSAGAVPSGMDNDPNADEEVINQQGTGRNAASPSPREQYPKPVEESTQSGGSPKIVPDNLADSIAYAIDGSGPGPTNDTPNVSGHKVVTEGITGASLDDEEDAMRA